MARWRTKHGFCIQNSFRGLFIAPPHNLRHWVNVGELFVEVITSNTMFWVAEIRWSCCRFSFQRGKESCLLHDNVVRGIFVRFRPNAEKVVDLGRHALQRSVLWRSPGSVESSVLVLLQHVKNAMFLSCPLLHGSRICYFIHRLNYSFILVLRHLHGHSCRG